MQKKTLPYIEDYIEILSGSAGITKCSMYFSLARYDVQIVNSFADQTTQGIPFTDRQALLAHKLVVKYKRQFAQYGIDVGFHEEDGKFRHATRTVDRSRSIRVIDNQIHIRFPYESSMIDNLRDSGKNIIGSLSFNKDRRAWISALTEDRVIWVESLANKYQFDLDEQIMQAIAAINAAQECKYKIELIRSSDGTLTISNAESSLIDYVNNVLGGFGEDNLVKLIDYSGILGYTVSEEIQQAILHNDNIKTLLLKKESHIPLSQETTLGDIIQYATLTNRWPLYIFENESDSKIRNKLSEFFKEEEILVVGSKQRKIDIAQHQCVYLTNWQASWGLTLPLLISMTALMVGPKKQHILQFSDKVVYCTEFVYNPTNTQKTWQNAF